VRGEPPPELVEFCRSAYARLIPVLVLECHDRAVAEDLAQETLVRVWERWPVVAQTDSPMAWAYKVALNLARSWGRRRSVARRAFPRMAVEAGADPYDHAEGSAVRAAVAALPSRQRAAIVLRYFGDLDVATVAGLLGCSQGTVKALTSQGINHLRRQFGVSLTVEEFDHA